MELTFAQQSAAFLYSLLAGLALGALYGVIKLFRTAFSPGKAAVFVCDVAFMLVCSLSVFYLSLGFVEGYVRFYTVIGVFLGIIAYRLTLGRLFALVYIPIVRGVGSILRKISEIMKKFLKKLLKYARKILYNIKGRKG